MKPAAHQVAARSEVAVEFFGIPRRRAGVAGCRATGTTLGEALQDLQRQFPALAECCLRRGRLLPGCIANLGGERFVTDPDTPLDPAVPLLIFSADAGS